MDLALNALQWLICYESKPNQTKRKLNIIIFQNYYLIVILETILQFAKKWLILNRIIRVW